MNSVNNKNIDQSFLLACVLVHAQFYFYEIKEKDIHQGHFLCLVTIHINKDFMALQSSSLNTRPRPRGKTFGKQLGPPPTSSSIPSSTGSVISNTITNDKGFGTDSIPSSNILSSNIHINSSSTSTSTKKKSYRQAKLFADLDEAENLALKLLTLTSSTTQCLADGTSTHIPDISSSSISSTSKKKALDQKIIKKSENGKEYLKTVQNIHKLLSPYSNLVVAYKNHAIDTNNNSDQKKNTKESSSNDDDDQTQKKRQKSNMYAARVELRLALERKNVLQEALRLERQLAMSNAIKNK